MAWRDGADSLGQNLPDQVLVMLEILDSALVLLGRSAALEGDQIASSSGFRVHFARI
jgi:hypothetical protein